MKAMMALLVSGFVFAGCSSTTVIESVPSGAKLYLNGELAGTTPHVHTDTKWIGSPNAVTLKKDGYQDFAAEFRRNEKANVGAIVGGVFVLVPFLWAMGYNDKHVYEMVPTTTVSQ